MSSLAKRSTLPHLFCTARIKREFTFRNGAGRTGLCGPAAGLSQQALTIYYPTRGERQVMAIQSVLNNSVVSRPLSIIYWTD